MSKLSFFLSAGETSGDNAAARLVSALRKQHPDLMLFGLGGKRLGELGQRQLAEPEKLAVIGFWEVAQRLFFFRKLFHQCVEEIRKNQPDLIILVDYPGFNLRLAKAVKELGIPIVYYISPQVWAWGRKRLLLIKDTIDLMLPILPFEESFFRQHGIPCQYAGNYLMEEIPKEYVASSPPADGGLALLPGSRYQEIDRMLCPMLKAAAQFHDKYGIKSVVAGLSGRYPYAGVMKMYEKSAVTISYDNPRDVIFNSRLALTASGTATLEAGIIGRPMVVVYKTGFLTYHIARRLVKLDKIALVNLVLDDKVVPELVQNEATDKRMFDEIERLYTDKVVYERVQNRLKGLPKILGSEAASERAAALILERLR